MPKNTIDHLKAYMGNPDPGAGGAVIGVIQRISTDLQDESAAEVEKTDPAGYRKGSNVRVVNIEQRRTQHRADALERLAQCWLLQQRQVLASASQARASESTDLSSSPSSNSSSNNADNQPATRVGEKPRTHRNPQITAADTHTMVVYVDVAALSHSQAIEVSDASQSVSKTTRQPANVSAETAGASLDGKECSCQSNDADHLDGTNGFSLVGGFDLDLSGFAIDGAGDINQDGFQDLLIGAPSFADNLNSPAGFGHAYVVFGQSTYDASVDLTTLDAQSGFRLEGSKVDERLGQSVRGIGGINADGVDDFAVGSPGPGYVLYGRTRWIGDSGSPSCNKPEVVGTTDRGIFVWQDCPNGTPNGEWHMLATAGGSEKHIRYNGVIEAVSLRSSLTRTEPSNVLQTEETSASFRMYVIDRWLDGMHFSTEAGASICADLTLNDGGAPAFLGVNRRSLDTSRPVDLITGEECSLSNRPATCGRPTFDGTAGLYLWQDCATSDWRLAGVADRGNHRFTGTLSIKAGVAGVRSIRLESNDTLEVLSPDRFDFDMGVGNSGDDAVAFNATLNCVQSSCLSLGQDSTNFRIIFGSSNIDRKLRDPLDEL